LLQEVENGQPYDAKTDMYGLGCLGYEMASLESVRKRRCPTRVAMEDLALANLLTTQIRLYCRRPTRKLETGTGRASQLILPKQYSQDLGLMVSRLLEENVSRYLLLSV
jgi:hypothetical protein